MSVILKNFQINGIASETSNGFIFVKSENAKSIEISEFIYGEDILIKLGNISKMFHIENTYSDT